MSASLTGLLLAGDDKLFDGRGASAWRRYSEYLRQGQSVAAAWGGDPLREAVKLVGKTEAVGSSGAGPSLIFSAGAARTEAAAPFAVSERCAPRTRISRFP